MTDSLVLKNLIAGQETMLGQNFTVKSEFYSEYQTQVADATLFDIKMAISKARSASEGCKRLTFDERKEILDAASKKIRFDSKDLEYIVKYTGMPIKQVKRQVEDIKTTLRVIPELIEKRIGIKYGKIGRKPVVGENFFKFLHPIDGFAYVVAPANDPRVTAFVAAWLVSLGIPIVFKTASTDVLIAQKVIWEIINAGYLRGGINQVCWNTKEVKNRKLNFELVDYASAIWAFGDEETVDKLLRVEDTESGPVDHFSGKIILRHASGRTAGIYDDQYSPKKAAEIIVESALDWPIACNAMKAIFYYGGEDLEQEIKIKFQEYEKCTGDPMEEKTKVGYTKPQINNQVYSRIINLEKLGLAERILGDKKHEYQTTPILLRVEDNNSEFLSREYSTYILTLKQSETFEEAVYDANFSAGEANRLALSVFTEEEDRTLKTVLKAHHIKRARHSTELDLLFHEGNDYLHKLTIPQIHRVSF